MKYNFYDLFDKYSVRIADDNMSIYFYCYALNEEHAKEQTRIYLLHFMEYKAVEKLFNNLHVSFFNISEEERKYDEYCLPF